MRTLWVGLMVLTLAVSGCASWHYAHTKPGALRGQLKLQWFEPDLFIFLPDPVRPLTFTRANQDTITPGRMYTDGGSIPRPFWVVKHYSPWGYAPAFMVHDWLFHMRHCQLPGYDKYDVDDAARVMSEVMKTMMEQADAVPTDKLALYAMFEAVRSPVAAQLWNQSKEESCKEPPAELIAAPVPPGAPRPARYDLVLNMDKLTVNLAVSTVLHMVRSPEISEASADAIRTLGMLALASRAEAALSEAMFGRGLAASLSVSVPEPGKLRVSGNVETEAIKAQAENVSRSVKGVESIENSIQVIPLQTGV